MFFIKKYENISMTFKIEYLSFFITLNPNDGNETKSGIFSWDIFKSDIIFNWSQNYEIFK